MLLLQQVVCFAIAFHYNFNSIHRPAARPLFVLNSNGACGFSCRRCVRPLAATIDTESALPSEMNEKNNLSNTQSEIQSTSHDPQFWKRNKHWIVLVDDEEDIRIAVGDYLYDQGYQVTACADADSLFEVCQRAPPPHLAQQQKPKKVAKTKKLSKPTQVDQQDPSISPTTTPVAESSSEPLSSSSAMLPDVVISDIRMPGKDGMQLLTMLRKDDSRWERVPVILLTAKALPQDRIAGYKAGADYVLPKPFQPEELLSIVDSAILRRQQMSGSNGQLLDLKYDLSDVRQILLQRGSNYVKKTNVYLTPAEREVLELLCQGRTNGEIAAARGVSITGVNRMIPKLYALTQTRSRTGLLRWAISTGYVSAK